MRKGESPKYGRQLSLSTDNKYATSSSVDGTDLHLYYLSKFRTGQDGTLIEFTTPSNMVDEWGFFALDM